MSLSNGQNLILHIVRDNPGLGKTAVMKILFMLQQVKGVHTGYDFSIYTYGPYSPDVMEDIDDLVSKGLVICTMYPSHTYVGYKLTLDDAAGINHIKGLNNHDSNSLNDIIKFAKGKKAKELELYSTIIYVDSLCKKNRRDASSNHVADEVQEIKPKFSMQEILDAHKSLKQQGFI